jgi:hypothetical protein
MARAGEHNRETQFFDGPGSSRSLAKHGAHFEEADVALSHSPVVLDATHQPGQ